MLALRPSRVGDLGAHGVEGRARAGDLEGAVLGQRRRHLAHADRARRGRQSVERAGHRACHPGGQEQADDRDRDQRHEHGAHEVRDGAATGVVGAGQDQCRASLASEEVEGRGQEDVLALPGHAEGAALDGDRRAIGDEVDMRHGDGIAELDDAAVGARQEDDDATRGHLVLELADDDAWPRALVDPQARLRDQRDGHVGQRGAAGVGVQVAQQDEEDAADGQQDRERDHGEGTQDASSKGHRGWPGSGGRPLARRRHQAVADAADGLDRRRVLAELRTDGGHMHVDGPRLAREVGAPDR